MLRVVEIKTGEVIGRVERGDQFDLVAKKLFPEYPPDGDPED